MRALGWDEWNELAQDGYPDTPGEYWVMSGDEREAYYGEFCMSDVTASGEIDQCFPVERGCAAVTHWAFRSEDEWLASFTLTPRNFF